MAAQILLLSHPRTASHLFERMLSQQPDVRYLGHPFVSARPAQFKSLDDPSPSKLSSANEAELRKAWDAGLSEWQEALDRAKKADQKLFVHTHPHFALAPDLAFQYVLDGHVGDQSHGWSVREGQEITNFTIIPDAFLLQQGTIPVFTIRHPGLFVPSSWRAMYESESSAMSESQLRASRPNTLVATNLGWSRTMYDWYLEKGVEPVIVDADDYMTSREFMRQLAVRIGLDPDHVVFNWPKATEQELLNIQPPIAARIKKTLLSSDGIIPGHDARALKLDDEEQEWREEFGEPTASFLKELVDRTMPHYEYLHERRLRLEVEN